jgi:hypothetical protein
MAEAIEQLVSATVASFRASDSNDDAGVAPVDTSAAKPAALPRRKAPAASRARTV